MYIYKNNEPYELIWIDPAWHLFGFYSLVGPPVFAWKGRLPLSPSKWQAFLFGFVQLWSLLPILDQLQLYICGGKLLEVPHWHNKIPGIFVCWSGCSVFSSKWKSWKGWVAWHCMTLQTEDNRASWISICSLWVSQNEWSFCLFLTHVFFIVGKRFRIHPLHLLAEFSRWP